MRFHDVEQNTEAWLELRAGKLTSSDMAKVMAHYPKAFGDQAKKLAVEIALEQITGDPTVAGYSNEHMERGHEHEPIARGLYEAQTFCTVTNGGFFDLGFTGLSPDGLVDDDGVIEIKSAIPSVHFARVRRGKVDPAYKWQCIFNLKGTKRSWLDFISYCPAFPADGRLYICRLAPDQFAEEFKQLDDRIDQFRELVHQFRKEIINGNYQVTAK